MHTIAVRTKSRVNRARLSYAASGSLFYWGDSPGDRPTAQRILASALLQKKAHQRDNSRENYGALPLQPIVLQK